MLIRKALRKCQGQRKTFVKLWIEIRSSAKRKPVEEEILNVGPEFEANYSRKDWIDKQRTDPTLDVY